MNVKELLELLADLPLEAEIYVDYNERRYHNIALTRIVESRDDLIVIELLSRQPRLPFQE